MNFAANGALLHISIQRLYVWVRKVSNKAKAMGPHKTQTKQTYKKTEQILIKDILNCCNIRATQHIKESVSTLIWNGTASTYGNPIEQLSINHVETNLRFTHTSSLWEFVYNVRHSIQSIHNKIYAIAVCAEVNLTLISYNKSCTVKILSRMLLFQITYIGQRNLK